MRFMTDDIITASLRQILEPHPAGPPRGVRLAFRARALSALRDVGRDVRRAAERPLEPCCPDWNSLLNFKAIQICFGHSGIFFSFNIGVHVNPTPKLLAH